jgi:hypothetical protein
MKAEDYNEGGEMYGAELGRCEAPKNVFRTLKLAWWWVVLKM